MSSTICLQMNKSILSICNFTNLQSNILTPCLRKHSTSCAITKQGRKTYPRTYKTIVALQDGSTIEVRCEHPRKLVQLPIDMTLLTDQERKELWLSRKAKLEHKEIEFEDDNYDSGKYRNLF